MTQTLRRQIHPETRVVDADAGIAEYVASDETLDSYREIIASAGWRFTHFRKNAPFVDSHDYSSIDRLLGSVTSFRVDRAGRLVERVQWAKDVEENHLARLGWKMTESGHLKAVSVGFFPTRFTRPGQPDWADTIDALGVDPETADLLRAVYLEQEQVELSACILGANPNALAKAWRDEAIGEEDMVPLGFDTADELELLDTGSRALASPECDDLIRRLFARELARIYHSRQGHHLATSQSAPSAGMPGGADAASRQAEERARFLTELRTLTNPQ